MNISCASRSRSRGSPRRLATDRVEQMRAGQLQSQPTHAEVIDRLAVEVLGDRDCDGAHAFASRAFQSYQRSA
jgi:hypothetical protein